MGEVVGGISGDQTEWYRRVLERKAKACDIKIDELFMKVPKAGWQRKSPQKIGTGNVEKGVSTHSLNFTHLRKLGFEENAIRELKLRSVEDALQSVATKLVLDELQGAIAKQDVATFNSLYHEIRQHNVPVSHSLIQDVITIDPKLAPLFHLLVYAESLLAHSPTSETSPLTPYQALQLACRIQMALQTTGEEHLYIRRGPEALPRDILINFQRKEIYVISKKASALKLEGGLKRITNIIRLPLLQVAESAQMTNSEARTFVRAVNISGANMEERERELEDKFGEHLFTMSYTGKKGGKKTLYIDEKYDDGDLYHLAEKGPIPLSKLIQSSIAAAFYLGKVHFRNYVHFDVKSLNILLKRSGQARLIDYDRAYSPYSTHHTRLWENSYGTPNYTAPEVRNNVGRLADRFEQGLTEDMFALGFALLETMEKVDQMAPGYYSGSQNSSQAEQLGRIIGKLLDPNPKSRMKLDEFLIEMIELDPQQAALIPNIDHLLNDLLKLNVRLVQKILLIKPFRDALPPQRVPEIEKIEANLQELYEIGADLSRQAQSQNIGEVASILADLEKRGMHVLQFVKQLNLDPAARLFVLHKYFTDQFQQCPKLKRAEERFAKLHDLLIEARAARYDVSKMAKATIGASNLEESKANTLREIVVYIKSYSR